MRYLKTIPLLLVVLVLSGCTSEPVRQEKIESDLTFKSETAKEEATAQQKQTQAQQQSQQQSVTPSSTGMYTQAPEMQIDPAKKYLATLQTEKGSIVIELAAQATPKTVNNFVFLAREGFYDGTIFHRTIPGFMIQGGDPEGTGRGGPGYKFPDEPFTGEYARGTVAMANAGPNTNGSQFFIMHKDTGLPKDYVIFGKVVNGLEAVDAIATAPTQSGGEGSTPVTPVKVTAVTITEE